VHSNEEKKEEKECQHVWKGLGTKVSQAKSGKKIDFALQFVCVKCGEKKEIKMFP